MDQIIQMKWINYPYREIFHNMNKMIHLKFNNVKIYKGRKILLKNQTKKYSNQNSMTHNKDKEKEAKFKIRKVRSSQSKRVLNLQQ